MDWLQDRERYATAMIGQRTWCAMLHCASITKAGRRPAGKKRDGVGQGDHTHDVSILMAPTGADERWLGW